MFYRAITIMIAMEALSLLSFSYPVLALPLLILLGLAVFVLTLKNPNLGLYFLFGELFLGSRGRLLEYDIVSLRMVVFSAVMLGWILSKIPNSKFQIPKNILTRNFKLLSLYFAFLLFVAFGAVNGLFGDNGILNIFNDINGYLYWIVLLPVMFLVNSKNKVKDLLQILAAGILVIAGKTLLLFIWFAGDISGVATLYNWVVNQHIGEITGIAGTASRIFMQSQFYALIGIFVFGSLLLGKKYWGLTSRQMWIVFFAAIFSVMMSLSRSFWLGAFFAGLFIAFTAVVHLKVSFKQLIKFAGVSVLIVVLELTGVFIITKAGGGDVSSTVSSRTKNPTEEAAGGARLLLLPELLSEIKERPFFGKGYGAQVSYKSFLPDRITEDNPDGEIVSFAFEWGYLDIALKIGSLGLLFYLFFIAHIFKLGWDRLQSTDYSLLITGLLSGVVALLTLNITTPYLNHPLGIGYLILSVAIFSQLKFIQQNESETA